MLTADKLTKHGTLRFFNEHMLVLCFFSSTISLSFACTCSYVEARIVKTAVLSTTMSTVPLLICRILSAFSQGIKHDESPWVSHFILPTSDAVLHGSFIDIDAPEIAA